MEENLLIVLVGLPRSGKTTWAKDYMRGHAAAIVNPDSIRYALHGHRFIAEAEPFVWAVAKAMVAALFLAGHTTVVVDATNTTRKRRDDWKGPKWRTAFKVIGTSKETCLHRAAEWKDDEIVPVIERMATAFEPLEADERPFGD